MRGGGEGLGNGGEFEEVHFPVRQGGGGSGLCVDKVVEVHTKVGKTGTLGLPEGGSVGFEVIFGIELEAERPEI